METVNQIDENTYEIEKTIPEEIIPERTEKQTIVVSEIRNEIRARRAKVAEFDLQIDRFRALKAEEQAQITALRALLTKINVPEE